MLCHAISTVLSDLIMGCFLSQVFGHTVGYVPLMDACRTNNNLYHQDIWSVAPVTTGSTHSRIMFIIVQAEIVRGDWIRLTGERPFIRSLVPRDLQVPSETPQLPAAGHVSG